MKICMISIADKRQPYGSTTRPFYLINELSGRGFSVLHICESSPSHGKNVDSLSIQDYGVSLLNYVGKSKKRIQRIILEKVKRFSPDIIYTHQIVSGNIGLRLKYLLKKPHVYDAHSSVALEMPTRRNISLKNRICLPLNEKILLKLTNKIIAPSIELKEFLIKRHRIDPKKITIIKTGVDTSNFQPKRPNELLKKKLGISDDDIIIVFTNPRLPTFPTNEIALYYFFGMIPEIVRRIPKIKFIIVGGGPKLEPPSEKVIYTGFVEYLPNYINLANICIAPFPPHAICGGTRNKVCEYIACGKAIVSTKEGMRGFNDAIPDVHFLLAKDSEDFIKKLVYLINNPDKAKQLGRNARILSKRYDWGHLSKELEEVLIYICNG